VLLPLADMSATLASAGPAQLVLTPGSQQHSRLPQKSSLNAAFVVFYDWTVLFLHFDLS
jgi:hypothetical protein